MQPHPGLQALPSGQSASPFGHGVGVGQVAPGAPQKSPPPCRVSHSQVESGQLAAAFPLHVQTPLPQVAVGQTTPQRPQLVASIRGSTQVPRQQRSVDPLQTVVQEPQAASSLR